MSLPPPEQTWTPVTTPGEAEDGHGDALHRQIWTGGPPRLLPLTDLHPTVAGQTHAAPERELVAVGVRGLHYL